LEHDIVSILNNRQRHVTKLTWMTSHSSSRPNTLRGVLESKVHALTHIRRLQSVV